MLSWNGKIRRGQKHDGATAHFASGDFETGIVDDEFFERELRGLARPERLHHTTPDLQHETLREARGQRRGEDAPTAIHTEAARVQLQQRLGSFEKAGQEAHNVRIFFMRSRTSVASKVFFQPTQRFEPPFWATATLRCKPMPVICWSPPA